MIAPVTLSFAVVALALAAPGIVGGPPHVPHAPNAPNGGGPHVPSPPVTPPAPKLPSGGNFGGHSPLDRKLRVDKERFRELAEKDDATQDVTDVGDIDGKLGDRLVLDLALRVSGSWSFEAVAGTSIDLVARIEDGRGAARLKLHAPAGGHDEDVIVLPGSLIRLDKIVVATTGRYRVELLPQPGDATGKLLVTTSARPPIEKPKSLALEAGRPAEIAVEGMTGRALKSLTWSVPKTDAPPRPFVDLQSPSGKTTRIEARVVDGSPTRVTIEGVPLDELGKWTVRLADLSRESRAGTMKLVFTEPAPGREIVHFE